MEGKDLQVNLSEYIRVLFRGRWIIFITFVLVVTATAYLTYEMRPVFEAETSVMIEESTAEKSIFDMSPFFFSQTNLINQMEVLRSRTLAESVIRTLENSPYRSELAILGDYLTFDDKVEALQENMDVEQIKDQLAKLKVELGPLGKEAEDAKRLRSTIDALEKELLERQRFNLFVN